MARPTKARVAAIAYLRTSSATNVGADKDSDKRQRQAIEAYAKHAGHELVGEFYDKAVSGADPIETRPGFAAMLQRIAANGARTIIVETASPATSWCRRLAMRCYANSAYPDCRRQPTLLSRRWTDREAYPPGARCHC